MDVFSTFRNNPRRYSRYHIKVNESERAKLASNENMEANKSAMKEEILPKDLEDLEESYICGCIPVSPETKKNLSQMLDLGLLKDSIFIMFVMSNFLTSIGFNVPYVYTVVRNDQKGP